MMYSVTAYIRSKLERRRDREKERKAVLARMVRVRPDVIKIAASAHYAIRAKEGARRWADLAPAEQNGEKLALRSALTFLSYCTLPNIDEAEADSFRATLDKLMVTS